MHNISAPAQPTAPPSIVGSAAPTVHPIPNLALFSSANLFKPL